MFRHAAKALGNVAQRTFTPLGVAYSLTVICLTCILLSIVSIQYANYVDRKSNRKWCNLITLIDDRNRQLQNPSSEQQKFIEEMHKLRNSLEC